MECRIARFYNAKIILNISGRGIRNPLLNTVFAFSCNNLRWGSALSHKLEVEKLCSFASYYSLTTEG